MNNKQDIFLNTAERNEFNDYFLFDEDNSIEVLPNLNFINILVGSNNSGKSRFMRALMKQKSIKSLKSYKFLKEKIDLYNRILTSLDIDWVKNTALRSTSANHISNTNPKIEVAPINFTSEEIFNNKFKEKILKHTSDLNITNITTKSDLERFYISTKTKKSINLSADFYHTIEEVIQLKDEIISLVEITSIGNNLNYLIPTLRTAHSLFEEKESSVGYSKLKKNIFLDTIVKNYKLGPYKHNESILDKGEKLEEKKIYIFTGLDLYNQIVNARNGLKEERKRFDDFEKFVGKEFFNTESIDIVAQFNINEKHNNNDSNEIINIHIKNDSRNLHDLGDGIQSLIILMYSIFIAPNNTFIFIDEPELNLHPGMQRLFLEQITKNQALTKKNLTYIIATHSNHLLDLTIEKDNISIYSFSKKGETKFQIKNVNAGNNEVIRELGVNNSSVFLANSSIWVEGISDRNYIKAFLIAYCNSEKN